jgi:hypothetical protein
MQDFSGNAKRKEITFKTYKYGGSNIKIYLREVGWDGMDWIDLTRDRD